MARRKSPSSLKAVRMMTTIGFYLSGVIAVGIIFIGCRFLLAPSTAAVAYGVAVNDG
jgi:hypothetical protein